MARERKQSQFVIAEVWFGLTGKEEEGALYSGDIMLLCLTQILVTQMYVFTKWIELGGLCILLFMKLHSLFLNLNVICISFAVKGLAGQLLYRFINQNMKSPGAVTWWSLLLTYGSLVTVLLSLYWILFPHNTKQSLPISIDAEKSQWFSNVEKRFSAGLAQFQY